MTTYNRKCRFTLKQAVNCKKQIALFKKKVLIFENPVLKRQKKRDVMNSTLHETNRVFLISHLILSEIGRKTHPLLAARFHQVIKVFLFQTEDLIALGFFSLVL